MSQLNKSELRMSYNSIYQSTIKSNPDLKAKIQAEIALQKQKIECDSFKLLTALSPGTALKVVMDIPNDISNQSLIKMKDAVTTAKIPLLSELRDEINCDLSATRSSPRRNCFFNNSNKLKSSKSVRRVSTSSTNEEKEKNQSDRRANAIIQLLESKRIAYREQAFKEIRKHSERSRNRVKHLDQVLANAKLISDQKKLHKKTKKVEINYSNKTPNTDYKSKWYHKVSDNYHGNRVNGPTDLKTEDENVDDEKLNLPVNSAKKIEISNSKKNNNNVNSVLPKLVSLDLDISLHEETLYFYNFINNSTKLKNDRNHVLKKNLKRMSEQVIRNKITASEKWNIYTLKKDDENLETEAGVEEAVVIVSNSSSLIDFNNENQTDAQDSTQPNLELQNLFLQKSAIVTSDSRRSFAKKSSQASLREIVASFKNTSPRQESLAIQEEHNVSNFKNLMMQCTSESEIDSLEIKELSAISDEVHEPSTENQINSEKEKIIAPKHEQTIMDNPKDEKSIKERNLPEKKRTENMPKESLTMSDLMENDKSLTFAIGSPPKRQFMIWN